MFRPVLDTNAAGPMDKLTQQSRVRARMPRPFLQPSCESLFRFEKVEGYPIADSSSERPADMFSEPAIPYLPGIVIGSRQLRRQQYGESKQCFLSDRSQLNPPNR